jgi:hypothetical protein
VCLWQGRLREFEQQRFKSFAADADDLPEPVGACALVAE